MDWLTNASFLTKERGFLFGGRIMRLFIINCVLALSVFIQVNIASAEPFEFRDYRQGMSLVQIQRVAEKNGHTLRPAKQQGNFTNFTVLSEAELVNENETPPATI